MSTHVASPCWKFSSDHRIPLTNPVALIFFLCCPETLQYLIFHPSTHRCLKISILRQSFPCSCSLSSCVLFSPPFFTVKFLLKKCFLFPSPLILPSAYTNQIAITPPPMRPVLSRSTVVGGDHMFLFAMRVPVCTRSWQIINNFPLTLKKKKNNNLCIELQITRAINHPTSDLHVSNFTGYFSVLSQHV